MQDSTIISLPEVLAEVWQGCDTGTAYAGNAALKLQIARDLRTGQLLCPHQGREPVRNELLTTKTEILLVQYDERATSIVPPAAFL